MKESFFDELEKLGGVSSELLGTILWSSMFPGLTLGLGGGSGLILPKKNREKIEKQNKAFISNLIFPTLGAHRLARRIKSSE